MSQPYWMFVCISDFKRVGFFGGAQTPNEPKDKRVVSAVCAQKQACTKDMVHLSMLCFSSWLWDYTSQCWSPSNCCSCQFKGAEPVFALALFAKQLYFCKHAALLKINQLAKCFQNTTSEKYSSVSLADLISHFRERFSEINIKLLFDNSSLLPQYRSMYF